MSEQRFRFRFPWQAASRPSQATQVTSSPVSETQPAASPQRRPFRPGGSAQPQTGRAEPPPVSPSSKQKGPPSRSTSRSASNRGSTLSPEDQRASPSRTTSRSASKRGSTPSPEEARASPSRVVPHTQSASPSREDSQQAKSIGVPTTPPKTTRSADIGLEQEVKPLSPQKKQSSTTEITKPEKEQREQKPFLPSSQKPHSVDTIQDENELLALEETKLRQSHVSVPKPESKQESREEVYEASSKEPVEILKGIDYKEQEKKAVIQENGEGSKAKIGGDSFAMLNDLGQHPREDVFDRKEIIEEYDNKSEHFSYENIRFNHKQGRTGGKASSDKEIKENLPNIIHKLDTPRDKYALNEKPFSITTLTGENTGATMHLSSEPVNRERPIHIHRGYKPKLDESVDPAADHEGTSGGRKPTNTKIAEDPGKKLCVNNNAQGINNSLVFHSSVTERNPGAHVVLSYKVAEPVKTGKEVGPHESHKAEVSTTSAERLTYIPNIRRRCLKGLFLESSDSDPGNLEKPRRHGCRAGCSQKSSNGFD